MKNLLLSAAFVFAWSFTYSQLFVSPNLYGTIDTNNIASGFNTNGDLFSKDTIIPSISDSEGVIQEFRVPKNGAASAIFSGNIWIAGMSSGNLYSSSKEYYSSYRAGPINQPAQDSGKWDKIWTISRTDVLSVKNDFDVNHAITLPVPASVLQWPANGNVNAVGNGGAALTITQDMAPFVDRNGDGIYNVYDGDYPLVRGDVMLWWINSDSGSVNQNPMGVDRRYTVYEYGSATDSNLNNTLFMSVKIKNQSARSYDSVLIGSFVDFDLGCANNDRVGSMPSKNSFFVYNGFVSGATQFNGVTCDEGSICPTSEVGYGCSLPIMTATFLNDSMKSFSYCTNGSALGQADPADSDIAFYRNMNGQWIDGTPLTYGGTGYGGTAPTPYAFPGNPADGSQWSECNPQSGPYIAAGDRRAMGAIGPFSLGAGDTISFDMAFIFHAGPYDNCPDLSDSSIVTHHIDSILPYYITETFPGWYDSTKSLTPTYTNVGIHEVVAASAFSVIPNPNTGSFILHVSNTAGIGDYSITVTDVLGQVVYSGSSVGSADKSITLQGADNGIYSVTVETQNYKSPKRIVITQ
jgi:hypothetical protein